MRVDLVVPDEASVESAERAWNAFRAAIRPLEFPELSADVRVGVESNMGLAPRAIATGAWVPPVRMLPEYAEFHLGPAFFALDEEARMRALLHEATHVRIARTRLVANYRLIRAWPRFSRAENQFERDRENLAWEVLTLAQEIGVDKFLARTDYPAGIREEYFGARARAFYTNGEGHQYDDVRSPELTKYRAFFRLLRAQLGLLLVADPVDRQRLEARRAESSAALEAVAGDDLPWFRDLQTQLLAIDVDTEAADPNSYRELSDRILAVVQDEA